MFYQFTHRLPMLTLLGVIVLAGCTGGLGGLAGGGKGALSFRADPIAIDNSTLSQTNYSRVAAKPVTFNQSIEVQGHSRSVVVTVYMLQFQRTYQDTPLGTVVILSVPQIKILGQQFNLLTQLDPASLVSRAQGQSSDIKAKHKLGEQSVGIMGGPRTVEIYRGTTSQQGQDVRVKIYQTTFEHQGNTIVGLGTIPEAATTDGTSVLTLFKGLRQT